MAVTPVNCSPRAHAKGFEGKLREETALLFLSLHQPRDLDWQG